MTVSLTGSGVATSCAAGLLSQYAATLTGDRRGYVLYVRDELCAEYRELERQRDEARNSAISYAEGKLIDSSWGQQDYGP